MYEISGKNYTDTHYAIRTTPFLLTAIIIFIYYKIKYDIVNTTYHHPNKGAFV